MTLNDFEGREVAAATIKVTANFVLEPAVEHQTGERLYVVVEADVATIGYEPIKDTDMLRRVHTLKTSTAAVIDRDVVIDVIQTQQRANEAAAGILRLDAIDADSEG